MLSATARPSRQRRWRSLRRRFNRWLARVGRFPRLEFVVAALAIVFGVSSYEILTGRHAPAAGWSPPLVTLVLFANLLPLMALIVLIARRITLWLTARRRGTAGARLHVRLVALFATIAAVPTLLVVGFASLLFQFGVQYWFSDKVRLVFENADKIANTYVDEQARRMVTDLPAMAADMGNYGQTFGYGSRDFGEGLIFQLRSRHLMAGTVFTPEGKGYRTLAVGFLDKPFPVRLQPQDIAHARAGEVRIIAQAADRIEAVIRMDQSHYLYVSSAVDPRVLNQVVGTKRALAEYHNLQARSRGVQLRFNALLVVVTLLILAAAVWFALWLANALVRPVARLADAAARVGAGDLDARVPVRGSPDEIGTLARAFNRMTRRLKAQQTALVTANSQLDTRRQFTEAVLSGVSAGVVSIDAGGIIRLANASAAALLQTTDLAGRRLADTVPELAALLDEAAAQGLAAGQVEIVRGADTQTLAVRLAAERSGTYVLTFDDITGQLADQRQAAWADVARRIAHEIKNPLTPIQLSAERLQRKYARQIVDDPDTFASLTGTIIRQVGDLRRMVDEFSSFARMPKPVFRPEPLVDLAREAVFMQEVANPAIAFTVDVPDAVPLLVCDRRQIAQALTNLIKNATEAVAARTEREALDGRPAHPGTIALAIDVHADRIVLSVTDNGIGLPTENRDRLTEPYVTTRARGTGLGLAIVKKIVEEHGGTLDLGDAPGGGTVARLCFDRTAVVADFAEAEPPRREMMAASGRGIG